MALYINAYYGCRILNKPYVFLNIKCSMVRLQLPLSSNFVAVELCRLGFCKIVNGITPTVDFMFFTTINKVLNSIMIIEIEKPSDNSYDMFY